MVIEENLKACLEENVDIIECESSLVIKKSVKTDQEGNVDIIHRVCKQLKEDSSLEKEDSSLEKEDSTLDKDDLISEIVFLEFQRDRMIGSLIKDAEDIIFAGKYPEELRREKNTQIEYWPYRYEGAHQKKDFFYQADYLRNLFYHLFLEKESLLRKCRSNVPDMNREYEKKRKENFTLKAEHIKNNNRIRNLEEDIRLKDSRNEELEKRLAAANAEITLLKQEVLSERHKAEGLEKEVLEKEVMIASLGNEMRVLRKEWKEVGKWKRKLSLANNEIEILRERCRLQERHIPTAGRRKTRRDSAINCNFSVSELVAMNGFLMQEMSELKKQNNDLIKIVNQLTVNEGGLLVENQRIREEYLRAENALNRTKAELHIYRREMEMKEGRVSRGTTSEKTRPSEPRVVVDDVRWHGGEGSNQASKEELLPSKGLRLFSGQADELSQQESTSGEIPPSRQAEELLLARVNGCSVDRRTSSQGESQKLARSLPLHKDKFS
ncbi:ELKS/Rab6-interacting/CAST family member 1-like [Macrobrachium rosenbergii]|uniref:ELKS/Rab6-interacting/CAST family member 1-like n=1 Tax=Macrobrachium rosenbergii TaxID=79674 RepID=UPI0034D79120